ncbi:oxygen-independent coproporphyrinogen III oxidase [Tropicimonas sp. IMCC34011]|uniref:oxygen-independent coproporphyrinogen III oxidase n=1 Tax=Tropicimonas sp. IMCC34011 TaxID=2248759 RepID=UPI000E238FAA|nr:oxygen-independent coproporphyrinogen III oxidase [Tropicimonas sp. IMCC34011]
MTHHPLRTALLDSRVPRYTSYPPANRFSASVGPETVDRWLRALPDRDEVSLYVHVPFCRRLCWFCACRTQGTRTDAPLDRYLDHLAMEIPAVRGRLPERLGISALHLGGGTPTLLSPERLDRLAAMLRGAFGAMEDAEVSAEIDPCECDDARLDALARLGLSRASIGVQDFDPKVQAAIGREQPADITRAVVEGLRARGTTSVNFDLLYGLPYQTEPGILATLRTMLEMRPDRIALYGYAHVPWMARRQRLIPEDALPGAEERLALAAAAREVLTAEGYIAVGIDHYALPGEALAVAAERGEVRRNFQGYTTDRAETLIGFGPSAISRYRDGFAQNAPATGDWQRSVAEGILPTARGYAMDDADKLTAEAIERLMCDGRVDLSTLAARHGQPDEGLLRRAARSIADLPGIGTLEGGVLTASSSLYLRLLAARLDPCFAPDAGRFSMAS